jgi:hypothetical protein
MFVSRKMPGSPKCDRPSRNSRGTAAPIPMAGASVAAGLILLLAGLAIWTPATSAQPIPADAQATATVPAALFASWFESGTPTLDGVVKPADSVAFSNDPGLQNVDFYQWSEQMFLWLTSPAPITYGGGGGRIFSSPAFFDVSPPDQNGIRTFIPHELGLIRPFHLRAAKFGAHALPVILDRAGKMFEVERPKLGPTGKQLILNGEGKLVEFGRITLEKDGKERKPIFLDEEGKRIVNARPFIRPELRKSAVVARFATGNSQIFLNVFGNVIDTEEGQADNGVLLTQSGALIYYATMVNDVFAYFLTGTKGGGITPMPTQFPTTQAELNKVVTFAAAHGKTFPDPNALAIEIKTSWVETAGLANASSYITMVGTVPTYDKTDPKHWIPNGQKTVQLALVGMHVVGSANGHPEMIWATFEHFGNTPNATYTYNSTGGPNPKTVTQDTSGTWLFCPNGATSNFNTPLQSANGADIVSNSNNPIGPSNTIRFKPWGGAAGQDPNPLVADIAASNTQIISMNNSVRGQLVGADIRKNYFFMGATWTIGGAPPSGSFPNGNGVGTSQLANTTMETFQTISSSFSASNNCFGCHVGNTTSVSHVFPGLKKLF